MKKSILLTLGVFGASLAVANSISSGNIIGSGTRALMQNVTTSDMDYDGIINVSFVSGASFLGWTCTNSQAKENYLTPDQYGVSCGKTYSDGYSANWYLKKGDKVCVHIIGNEAGNLVWQLMDDTSINNHISLWGTAKNPNVSFAMNIKYLGYVDSCDKM